MPWTRIKLGIDRAIPRWTRNPMDSELIEQADEMVSDGLGID
jgi:hypothetical protein